MLNSADVHSHTLLSEPVSGRNIPTERMCVRNSKAFTTLGESGQLQMKTVRGKKWSASEKWLNHPSGSVFLMREAMWGCENKGETSEKQQSGSLEVVSLPPEARCVLVQSRNVTMKRELEVVQIAARLRPYDRIFSSLSFLFSIFCSFWSLSRLSLVSALLSAVWGTN